ncbi:hypothetical protein FRX31_026649 [Thalictrum thalictroides]|uniref:Response regulatory domain-containing protein n=1 Tax=Thalictrum thalictroides TaxID=46969 RepID=A0A7J6VHS3_THATH|nr:hypothetical protein FRX31_026649 [Thalictrum thalictroides]
MATDGDANGNGKEIMSESHMVLPNIKYSNNHFPNGFRVLVVDGCPMYLTIVNAYCGLCDYKATIVNSTIDAMIKLHETKGAFDLVLSEVYMEGIDGLSSLILSKESFKFLLFLLKGGEHDEPEMETSDDDYRDEIELESDDGDNGGGV